MSKILIVDNKEDNLLILEMMLEDYEIEEIITLTDAKLTKDTIDNNDDILAIFLDLVMPVSGFEIFDQIKDYGIPVFAYTAHTDLANEALSLGFTGFLGKPVDQKAFDKIMASLE